jgi:hypothetical protein
MAPSKVHELISRIGGEKVAQPTAVAYARAPQKVSSFFSFRVYKLTCTATQVLRVSPQVESWRLDIPRHLSLVHAVSIGMLGNKMSRNVENG